MLYAKLYGLLVGSAILALMALHLTPQTAHAPMMTHGRAASFSWSAGSPVTVPWLSDEDIRPMIVTNGPTFYILYSTGANTIKRWLCTSLDSCTAQSDGVVDSSFNHPYGDDRYWLGGGILYNGAYYAVVHVEFRYHSTSASNFHWFRRLGLATSTDQGAHWRYLGDIITSDFSTDIADFAGAPAFQTGPGDPSLFADWAHSMVYISYTTFWADVNTGARTEQTDIARCPMASITGLTCWHKWDYGNWTQPGLGGHNASIFPGEDNAAISWDSYLNAFVAIGHSTNWASYISTATSLDTQNWTPPQHFIDDSLMHGWYVFLSDENGDPFHLDQDFRVYSSGGQPAQYVSVTLSTP